MDLTTGFEFWEQHSPGLPAAVREKSFLIIKKTGRHPVLHTEKSV
jgi:hypothetical protein